MKHFFQFSKTSFFYVVIGSIISCSNNTEKQNNASTETPKAISETSTPTEKPETAIVRFKINGVIANTKVGTGNDKAEHIGIVNGTNPYLNFVLNGDDAKFPFRGSLSMGIDGFKFKTGDNVPQPSLAINAPMPKENYNMTHKEEAVSPSIFLL